MENEVKNAGFWMRQLAGFVDTLTFLPLYYVAAFMVTDNPALLSAVYYLLTAIYYIAIEASPLQGTIGKKICGLKVVDRNNQKISLLRSALRSFWFYVPMMPVIVLTTAPHFVAMAEKLKTDTQSFGNNPQAMATYMQENSYVLELFMMSTILLSMMTVMVLIWFLPMAFTRNKTGLHDIFSKTRVIRQR